MISDPYRNRINAERIKNNNRQKNIKCGCGHNAIDDHLADGTCVFCGCVEVTVACSTCGTAHKGAYCP